MLNDQLSSFANPVLFNQQHRHMDLDQNTQLNQYNASLQALLTVLPDNTEAFSEETIDAYVWVIEMMLSEIFQLSQQHYTVAPSSNT